MPRPTPAAVILWLVLPALPAPAPLAWDAAGHRTVTCLALARADLHRASWLGEAAWRRRLLFQVGRGDRFRGDPGVALRHVNEPEHYLEVDSLARHGLRLAALPSLRRAYLRQLDLPDPADGDSGRVPPQYLLAGPGLLAHAMEESRAWLRAALWEVRILEQLADPARRDQLVQARAEVIHHLGRLSHLVADGAQPLHTTRHFNGWSGANPHGFTVSRSFHRRVDSRPGSDPALSCAALAPRLAQPGTIPGAASWEAILSYLQRSFEAVEPLYLLERDGDLDGPAGDEFMARRLLAGAAMLAGLLQGALDAAAPDADAIRRFVTSTPATPAPDGAERGQEKTAGRR